MRQVLFWIPIKTSWFPDGIPVYAYGAMLFVTFIVVVWFLGQRSRRTGVNIPPDRIQDMAIVMFVAGLVGARLTYMAQFGVPWEKFFRIWEGGIVLYGGIIGGTIAFILFHRYVLRRLNITLWQMGDLIAPALAIGIALGRIGCLLNGCCWGTVAPSDCPAIEFPLLPAPAREMLVEKDGLQTVGGFLIAGSVENPDPRTVIGRVEPNSPAAKAGLKEGDRVVKFRVTSEWIVNSEILFVGGPKDLLDRLKDSLKSIATIEEVDQSSTGDLALKIVVEKPEYFQSAYEITNAFAKGLGRRVDRLDQFGSMLNNWPRGRNSVEFMVERGGEEVAIPAFTPLGIGVHPTQIYETISMILLLFLTLAYYPFRRHDGQVFVLWMIAYAIHRFLNEILRTEPIEGLQMTLSQNISVFLILSALGLEIYLRRTLPRRTTSF